MIGSLRTRLLGSMLVVTVIVVGTTWLVADPLLDERAEQDTRDELVEVAAEALAALEADAASEEDVAARLAGDHAVQVAVFGPDDRPLAATQPDAPAPRPRDLDRARAGAPVTARVERAGRAFVRHDAALADGRVVRVTRPMPRMAAARSALRQVLLLAGLFAMLAAAVLAEILGRSIGAPVREMTETTEALEAGKLDKRVRSRRADELGALGGAIDRMADQLVERLEAARREEERLRTILDAMVEGVLVTDANGRVVLTNAALVHLAGGNVEGRTAVEAIRSAELHEAVRRASKGIPTEVDFDLSVGSRRRSITAQTSPLPGGGGVVAVLHDVTQLKRADAVRRDFVANASHELRTPLTAIRGFAETLADGAMADEKIAQRFLQNIRDNASRLSDLVEDLLELSRAESPDSKVELVPVDVVRAAAKVIAGLEHRASDKGQDLVLETSVAPSAFADARALDQVLLNLVDNAIKYTPTGGRITVRARRDDGRVLVEVADTGPGIPRPHVDRIFERFYRVDKGRARGQGGTGLGLSIVRHLASRMNGEVTVESKVGEGSVFRVSLAEAPPESQTRLPLSDRPKE